MASEHLEDWLVRKQEPRPKKGEGSEFSLFVIHGPLTRKKLVQAVDMGEVTIFDEVGKAEGFWFSLSQEEDIRAELGIDPTRVRLPVAPDGTRTLDESTETETEVLSRPTAGKAKVVRVSVPEARKVEALFFWKAIAWILAFLSGILLYSIFHKLRSSGI